MADYATFDLTDLADVAETAAAEAIGEAVEVSHRAFRQRIPSARRKTRRSVVSQHQGTAGYVGVLFPPGSRYRAKGTDTERLAQDTWDQIERQAFDTFAQSITDNLTEFEL